jgi:hypothetical protein
MDTVNCKQLPLSSASQPFVLALLVRQYIEQISKEDLNSFMAQGLLEQVTFIPLVMPFDSHMSHFNLDHSFIF